MLASQIALFLFLGFSGCTYPEPAPLSNSSSLSGYNLTSPDKKMVLPEVLMEISGLTDIDSNTIACVQDENGILFIYDLATNKIKHQYNFHIDGDYEGITLVGTDIYILRSDGVVFQIEDYTSKNFKLHNYPTGIPANNNEGLCHDPDNNRLLVACKSKMGKGPEFKDKRFIYAFDLERKKLSKEPVFSFDVPVIKSFAEERKVSLPERSRKSGTVSVMKFFPSAIAIHPITKNLYLLSAADHMLFIFDLKGNPIHVEALDKTVFNKSEGITFFDNGDMIISNEGQNARPTLLRFNYGLNGK